jgi:hypothetical protein
VLQVNFSEEQIKKVLQVYHFSIIIGERAIFSWGSSAFG